MNKIAEGFKDELIKLARRPIPVTVVPRKKTKKEKERTEKRKRLGKAIAIGAGSSLAIGAAKGAVEKKLEEKLKYRIKSPTKRWAVARGIPSALASVGYTLATLKAVEAVRGKK